MRTWALATIAGACLLGSVVQPVRAHSAGLFIPGLTMNEAIDRFERFGLTCITGTPPNGVHPPPDTIGAACEGIFPDQSARIDLWLNYWADGHISAMSTTVGSLVVGEGEKVSPQFALRWAIHVGRINYTGADPDRTEQWLRDNADNPDCGQGCALQVGGARFFLAVSIHGRPGQVDVGGLAEPATVPDTGARGTTSAPALVTLLGVAFLLVTLFLLRSKSRE